MGLDGVEFILVVEDTFGVSIPDEEAERLDTPGKLHDYLILRLRETGPPDGEASSSVCLSSVVFYRLRGNAISALGLGRKELAPDTDLESLLGSGQVFRRKWAKWAKSTGASFPALSRAPIVIVLGWVIAVSLFLLVILSEERTAVWGGATIQFLQAFGFWVTMVLKAAFVAGFAAYTYFFLTCWLEVGLPAKKYKMGDLVRDYLKLNPQVVRSWADIRWTDADIWEWICILLEQQIRIPREEITRDRTFRELGMD